MPTVIHFVGGGYLSVNGEPEKVNAALQIGLRDRTMVPVEAEDPLTDKLRTFWVNPLSVTWAA